MNKIQLMPCSAQENGFGSRIIAYALLPWLASKRRSSTALCICRKECNKYDLTAAQCFSDWSIIMIRPGGLLLVVTHPPICLSQFQFYVWGSHTPHHWRCSKSEIVRNSVWPCTYIYSFYSALYVGLVKEIHSFLISQP
jgi:hypothetical protein